MNESFSHCKTQSGVSLIESLVALLVLALGILGMAGLQTRTLVESRSTNARASAVDMAEDLSERIQFNIGARSLPVNPYLTGRGPTPAAPADCFAVACTPAELAQMDLRQWKLSLAARLPQGDAAVFTLPNDPSQLGVLISWSDNVSAQVTDAVAFNAPLNVATGVPGQDCPGGLICHLVFIRP